MLEQQPLVVQCLAVFAEWLQGLEDSALSFVPRDSEAGKATVASCPSFGSENNTF
jgi:hypothetical protein